MVKYSLKFSQKKYNLKMQPAWEYHYNQINSSQVGNNYSLIGARIEETDSKSGLNNIIFNHFTIEKQINSLITQHKIDFNDWILINIGTNDLIFHYQKNAIIDKLLTKLKNELEKLVAKNAQKIILFEIIDLGQVPRFKNHLNAPLLTFLCYQFNKKIKNLANELMTKNPHVFIEIYRLFEEINLLEKKFIAKNSENQLQNFGKLNLLKINKQGIVELMGSDNLNLQKINNYFYVDDVHLNSWVHDQIANDFYNFLQKLL